MLLKWTEAGQPPVGAAVVRSQASAYNFASGGKVIKACLTPRSAIISSLPPKMLANLKVRWMVSTFFPMPLAVKARPPKI
mmetsp:Transcript_35001/g.69132  ORF Transcript_35001/g.69132 Transcript_35001/m.69132 type:complete len:80 (-) Transcript_35001:1518-1757(-)